MRKTTDLKLERIFKIFVFGLYRDFSSVDGQNFSLKIHQLALDDLHVVTGGKVVRQVVLVRSA